VAVPNKNVITQSLVAVFAFNFKIKKMDKKTFYHAKTEAIEDMMSFMAIVTDSDLSPVDQLTMLDRYMLSQHTAFTNAKNEYYNEQQSQPVQFD